MVGETDRKKVQAQVPWIPTTPLKPIPHKPVPICTPAQRIHLGSHSNGVPACYESSASAEINNRQHFWPTHEAAVTNVASDSATTRVRLNFDNMSSSSNGFAQLLALADAASAHSDVTHDGFLKNQFVPTLNSQFKPTYTLLGHRHASCEQTLFNGIQDNYRDPQGKGIKF